MTPNVTPIDMPQVDVETHQKQGFVLAPQVFDPNHLTILSPMSILAVD